MNRNAILCFVVLFTLTLAAAAIREVDTKPQPYPDAIGWKEIPSPAEGEMFSIYITGAQWDQETTVERDDYPTLGELSSILDVLAESMDEPAARAVLVTGAPGVGKSRLRRELMAEVARRHGDALQVWTARPGGRLRRRSRPSDGARGTAQTPVVTMVVFRTGSRDALNNTPDCTLFKIFIPPIWNHCSFP